NHRFLCDQYLPQLAWSLYASRKLARHADDGDIRGRNRILSRFVVTIWQFTVTRALFLGALRRRICKTCPLNVCQPGRQITDHFSNTVMLKEKTCPQIQGKSFFYQLL